MADNQQLENDFIAISTVSRESSDLNEMCPRIFCFQGLSLKIVLFVITQQFVV